MSVRLHTVKVMASATQRVPLNPPPLSGILGESAIVFDSDGAAAWHDGVGLIWDSGAAYAVFDQPISGWAVISYISL